MCLLLCAWVFYQEDEVRPLVVEGDGRTAKRGGCVVGALRGRMPESLAGQLCVIQLLLKVYTHTHTQSTQEEGEKNVSIS